MRTPMGFTYITPGEKVRAAIWSWLWPRLELFAEEFFGWLGRALAIAIAADAFLWVLNHWAR